MSLLDRFARRWLRRQEPHTRVHEIATRRETMLPHQAKAARKRHAANKVARASRKRNRRR